MTHPESYSQQRQLSPLFVEPDRPRAPQDEVSLVRLLNSVLRHRVAIVVVAAALAAVVAITTLLAPRTYTATAKFLPQAGRQNGGALAGVAAQLGLAVPGGDLSQSPQFYAELLTSRPLLRDAAVTTYRFRSDTGRVTATLADYYGGEQPSDTLRTDAAIRQLQGAIEVEIGTRTNVITVKVEAPAPELAQQVSARLVGLLNEFNVSSRRSQARAEREFTEQRLASAEAEYRTAQGQLLDFLQRNRDYSNSPTLHFEYERLSRDVGAKSQLVTALQQAFEQARIEEVRDTPVLTVIQAPEVPIRPDSRYLVVRTVFAFFGGILLGVIAVCVHAWFATPNAAPTADEQEFSRLRREAVDDLLHPWRPLSRVLRRRPAT